MENLINRDELRRLTKAAKEKDKRKLLEWAEQFEIQLRQEYTKAYEKKYHEDLASSIDIFCLAIAYTLHFSESTKFGRDRLCSFMEDMFATIDMFRTREYDPEDYAKQLEKFGIYFADIKTIRKNKHKIGDENYGK